MAYFTQTDIEQYTGFASSDFKQGGSTMTATQWSLYCSTVVDFVTQLVNRYCGVQSFEPHEMVEYRSGVGAKGDKYTYLEEDTTFYLSEYGTGIQAFEDIGSTGTEYWVERTARTSATSGDFTVATRNELTMVRFHNNIPQEGWNNVRFVYWGGYPEGSVQMNEIRLICLRIARNILLEKKKTQESTTIRQTGIRDYAQMFEFTDTILTDEIKQDLHKYRRHRLGGPSWW